ncbi:recombinase family protein [Ktedonobacteria bacterium brp13]|nr:recombinase family protein [Ktedonobacteria bacterium brp13]
MHQEQCSRVFTDKMSGKRFDRPEFLKMLDIARSGDVIVVWRLDRLGRSLKQLIETVTMLGERGIELRSLKENIDTTTSTGKW